MLRVILSLLSLSLCLSGAQAATAKSKAAPAKNVPPKAAPVAPAAPVQDNPDFLKTEFQAAQGRISSFREKIREAVEAARHHAPHTRSGIEYFEKYDALLTSRYVDEEGAFDPGAELTPVDRENLVRIHQGYLREMPFQGALSAGKARSAIKHSIRKLKTILAAEESPAAGNSSEIQILTRMIEVEEEKIDGLRKKAKALSLKLD